MALAAGVFGADFECVFAGAVALAGALDATGSGVLLGGTVTEGGTTTIGSDAAADRASATGAVDAALGGGGWLRNTKNNATPIAANARANSTARFFRRGGASTTIAAPLAVDCAGLRAPECEPVRESVIDAATY